MTKLEPTEAQRKALVDKLSEHVQWHRDGVEMAVDEMIAAANSIPDGAPVGTIARRPDGAFVAVRVLAEDLEQYWTYTCVDHSGPDDDWPDRRDADSWPVIYDPTGFSELSIDLGPDWGEWGCNTLVEVLSALGVKPVMNLGDIYEMVEQGLEWFPPGEEPLVPRPDPTAQQEPDRFPGIENPTTADHVGADNADEQLKLIFALQCIRVERGLSVAHVGEALGLEDSEVERFESGSTNPTMSMIRRYARAVEAVFTVDVRKWEDSSAQQEPGESLARGLDDIAAGRVSRRDDYLEPQPEPATTHPVSPESTNCVPKPRTPRVVDRQQEPALRERFPEQASAYVADPELVEVDDEPLPSGSLITSKPRTPRVVDRLGVDEQGSRWRNRCGEVHEFRDGCWKFCLGGMWYPSNLSFPDYTEILEPDPADF